MKILIIDNYDSFTYNLFQYVGEILLDRQINPSINVKRNDEVTLAEIKRDNYDRIIISPGPGNPADSSYFGVCRDVLLDIGKITPVLGVCLGMQGIGSCYGGRIVRATAPMHGKTSLIKHDGKEVFKALPQSLEVMRYHSLVVEKDSLPPDLVITAVSIDTNEIMGLRHRIYPIEGVQFHPESIFTDGGKQLLENFIL